MSHAIKQQWREFICSSATGGRFLASIGSSISLAPASAKNESELRSLLARLRHGRTDVRLVASVVDLLHDDYLSFFSREVSVLLDHLSSEVIKDEQVVGPALRGNPRWDRTMVARRTGALPVGRYFSRMPRRSFSKPENLLLKWLVGDILREIHNLEKQVGVDALPSGLRALFSRVELVGRHYWLSAVETPSSLTPEMVYSAKRGRRAEYRKAAELAVRRNGLNREVANGKWKALLTLLASGWLEPVDVDDLFELYALTLCLEVVAGELDFGTPREVGLVIRQRKYVARFVSGDSTTVEVYFDQSPQASLGFPGRYAEIIRSHRGVSGSARRPDITLIKTDAHGVRSALFVEVKKSQAREYLSDSVYKAFGYLHDYAGLWSGSTICPKVVLFVPEDVHLIEGHAITEVAFVSGGDRAGFSAMLRQGLAQPAQTA